MKEQRDDVFNQKLNIFRPPVKEEVVLFPLKGVGPLPNLRFYSTSRRTGDFMHTQDRMEIFGTIFIELQSDEGVSIHHAKQP